jgi:iron-sulfur cluster assembly accessory protein
VIEKDGCKLVIDEISLPYLEGSVVDYKETMIKSGFIVADNPKADLNCSCGTSFSVKSNNKL